MPQSDSINHRIVLAARPQGLPTLQDFRLERVAIPIPEDGQLLLRTLYLSLDPYMRTRLDELGTRYAPAVQLGSPIVGGTVNRVVASRHPRFKPSDLVLGNAGWQDYALSDGTGLTLLSDMAHPSLALGALGMTGFTAWHGLLYIGQPKPGETVLVAAATGAVGSVVGQIAKIKGARVVGIGGGGKKCRYAVDELGFDACIDRHEPALRERLAAACPQGVDVYFESVGGEVLDAVLPLLNEHARVPVCGLISHYNDTGTPSSPNLRPRLLWEVLQKRIRMEGFVIADHYSEQFDRFQREMGEWLSHGEIQAREDLVDGLEHAPSAFIGQLQGRNFGKIVVRVAGE